MEEIIAKFITKNNEFFRAKIRQIDSKHVFINDYKFTISSGEVIGKYLEIIIEPSDIEYFLFNIEEIISKARLKDYQDMVKLFLKFKESYAYESIQEELKRDPFMIKEFDQLNLLHLFQNKLNLLDIENHEHQDFLTIGNINIHFPIKDLWNKFIIKFYTSNQNDRFRNSIYGQFMDNSIYLINVNNKLMVNFIIPLSSIENEIENYRETIDNLVFQSFPNYSHELTDNYELLTTTNFDCREHIRFEMINIKKWDSIYSKLTNNYCHLLRDFLTIFMPIYYYRYTSSDHEYINKKIRKILDITDIPYKIIYNEVDHIVIIFKKSSGLKIKLGIKNLNPDNKPFKCSIYANRINEFCLDSTINPKGDKYIDFTFSSNHTN